MRKLITDDIFNAASLVRTAGVKETFERLLNEGNDLFKKGSDGKIKVSSAELERYGIHALVDIMDACGKAGVKEAFYEFLSGPFEVTPEGVKTMPLVDLAENFKKLSEENNLSAFFKFVGKSM